jgi:hypothetical protein
MIHDDEELTVLKKQLGRIERALEDLRQDVLPKNPRNYEIFAEPYIDQINLLKAEIDAYLAQKTDKIPDTTTTEPTSGQQHTNVH